MKTEKDIKMEIEKLKNKYYRGIPCNKQHTHYYYDDKKKLLKKEVPCDMLSLCGHCKSQLTQRVERQLIKQLNWVIGE